MNDRICIPNTRSAATPSLFAALLSVVVSMTAWGITPPAKGVSVPAGFAENARQLRSEYQTGYWAREMALRAAFQRATGTVGAQSAASATDTIRFPVLLGKFTDLNITYSRQSFQQLLFDGPNPSGTVTDFYRENSFGALHLTGNAQGWFDLPRGVTYYGMNGGLDNNARRDFAIELVYASDAATDFSQFVDKNSLDGEGYHVRLIAVVHTGAGAEAGAANIWSHRWTFRSRMLARSADANETLIDKSRILASGHYLTNDLYKGYPVVIDGDYACEPELSGKNNLAGPQIEIGVFCHEFGHLFGLPDLYDIDGSSDGLGNWCVMATGCYGGDGKTSSSPVHFSAWCKSLLGWITPQTVPSFRGHQAVRAAENFPDAFKLTKLGSSAAEYFLVENRQKVGFDRSLVRGGLLIYHIDSAVPDNTNENRYMVGLMQADNLNHLNKKANRADAGDPFPGSTGNVNFDMLSFPSSKDNAAGAATYVGVRNISPESNVMYADLDVGLRPLPRLLSVTQSDAGQSTVNGRIEPGESGSLVLKFENLNPTGASAAEARIIGGAEGLSMDTITTNFALPALGQATVTTVAKVRLQPGFVPREVALSIESAAPDFRQTTPLILPFGYPSLLLLDGDSTTQRNAGMYRAALDSFGRAYEVLPIVDSAATSTAFTKRSTVVVFTGIKKSQTISLSLMDSLNALMGRGGKVLVTGQNIAEDLTLRSPQKLASVFHLSSSENLTTATNLVWGMTGDPLGATLNLIQASGGDGAGNQTSPDVLLPGVGAIPFATYTTQNSSSVAGMRFEDPVHRSKFVFLGFGLEGINSSASAVSRNQTLQNILNYLDTPVGVEEQRTGLLESFVLYSPYPNPFNPSAAIMYNVPARGQVRLSVYNLLGQLVRDLVNDVVAPGMHQVTFRAGSLPAGLYLCRMTASGFVGVQKLLLLK